MWRHLIILGVIGFVVIWGLRNHASDPVKPMEHENSKVQQPQFHNPLGIAIGNDDQHAFVAYHNDSLVAVIDLKTDTVVATIPVDQGPTDIIINGQYGYVSCQDSNCIVQFDIPTKKVIKKHAVGSQPTRMAWERNNHVLAVTCQGDNSLALIHLKTGEKKMLSLNSKPVDVAYINDRLLVACQLTGKIELRYYDSHAKNPKIYRFDGISNLRDIARINDKTMALVYQKPRNHIPATQIAQGWVFTNNLGLINLDNGTITEIVLDSMRDGFADPSAIVVDSQRSLWLLSAGTDQVLQLKMPSNQKNYDQSGPSYQRQGTGSNVLTSRRHLELANYRTGNNPRRMALTNAGKLVISNFLGNSLSIIDAKKKSAKTVSLGDAPIKTATFGARYFHSANFTQLRQFSCASCHPDGHADGLNWDLSRDGIGNFLNTRSLLGVADTPGYGWHGTSPTLANRISGTLKNLHQYQAKDNEVQAIAAYLKTLRFPNQSLVLSVAAKRGRGLFHGKAKCHECHSGDILTDNRNHSIGTKTNTDIDAAFDTPSLRGLRYTASYLHDGRAHTLRSIFTEHNSSQRHGQAHSLTDQELSDLLAYLETL